MKFCAKLCACTLALAGLFFAGAEKARAQQSEHVVSSQDLRQATQDAVNTRHANEAAVRELLSTDTAQRAMKSANVDYKKVDQAIGQLNDKDLADLAQRSRDAQRDFAAGNFSDRDLLLIVLVVVGIVLIIVAVR